MLNDAIRDWKRRSKGRKDGVGLLMPGREANDGNTLLPGEDMREPCACQTASLTMKKASHTWIEGESPGAEVTDSMGLPALRGIASMELASADVISEISPF